MRWSCLSYLPRFKDGFKALEKQSLPSLIDSSGFREYGSWVLCGFKSQMDGEYERAKKESLQRALRVMRPLRIENGGFTLCEKFRVACTCNEAVREREEKY